jgi:TPR repeat protein
LRAGVEAGTIAAMTRASRGRAWSVAAALAGAAACATGYRMSKTETDALAWCESSPARATCEGCRNGQARDCLRSADLYWYGDGVPGDLAQWALFSAKACELGDDEGCVRVAWAYESEILPEQEIPTAGRMLRRRCDEAYEACERGLVARCGLAVRCAGYQGRTLGGAVLRGVVQACESGRAGDCVAAGHLTRDAARAVELYRRGCDGGVSEACAEVGAAQIVGVGGPRAPQAGVALLRRVCDETRDFWACIGTRGYLSARWLWATSAEEAESWPHAPPPTADDLSGATRRDRHALAVVGYCVDDSGAVERAEVLRSWGRKRVDAVLVATVERWRLPRPGADTHRCWAMVFSVNFTSTGRKLAGF